jgi:lipopolysaccharide/colanic/teichoic acid biosynthesis glycosyltransferase
MTLIGPRPEVPRFVAHYTPAERGLLDVRPGIIGPGAVLFAATQCGELDATADPDEFYVRHHLHPKLALDLDYLVVRWPWVAGRAGRSGTVRRVRARRASRGVGAGSAGARSARSGPGW